MLPAVVPSETCTKRVWIDLDNSPHVPFFQPIVRDLQDMGISVVLTARDAFQVLELAELYGLTCTPIGHHFGKNKAMKVLGTCIRAGQLFPRIVETRPDLALSHGSRAQALVAKVLGIRSMLIADYEHVVHLVRPDYLVVPEAIPLEVAQKFASQVVQYPGIKEDVYAPTFRPDPSILSALGLQEHEIIVTVRPPATEAHYHNPESERLFASLMQYLTEARDLRVVLLPRNARQRAEIDRAWSRPLGERKFIVPSHAVAGLNLVWHSDLVISGGGTMNREAAALGVPVYSIFRGKLGAVDRYLARTQRLVMIECVEDIEKKIQLKKSQHRSAKTTSSRAARESIANAILCALSTDRAPMASPPAREH